MERVVYLLGAGFSQPLGLPVISNFLVKARDLYFDDPSRYKSFEGVLKQIDTMHTSKSFYNVDLLNIEEILSILQMEDEVTGEDRSKEFSDFIIGVIKACTGEMPEPKLAKAEHGLRLKPDGSFARNAFGGTDNIQSAYGQFVANLINLRLWELRVDLEGQLRIDYVAALNRDAVAEYGVVTLNYDMVIENCINHIISNFGERSNDRDHIKSNLRIAKLHGSVSGKVVAPTWKKLASEDLRDQWKLAHELLAQANRIRILGYSLPVSDSYIQYLLVSAAMNSQNLKEIDVICLDDRNHSVEQRYREFINFNFYRFRNVDIRTYLAGSGVGTGGPFADVHTKSFGHERRTWADYDRLEKWHAQFMSASLL